MLPPFFLFKKFDRYFLFAKIKATEDLMILKIK